MADGGKKGCGKEEEEEVEVPRPPLYRQWGHLLVQTISIRYSPAPPLIAAARLAALLQITRYSTRWRIDSR